MQMTQRWRRAAVGGLALTSPAWMIGVVVLGSAANTFVSSWLYSSRGVAGGFGPLIGLVVFVGVLAVVALAIGAGCVVVSRAMRRVTSRATVGTLAALLGLVLSVVPGLGAFVGLVFVLIAVDAVPFLDDGPTAPWAYPVILLGAVTVYAVSSASTAVLISAGWRLRRDSNPQPTS
jgi:hypothetical protein